MDYQTRLLHMLKNQIISRGVSDPRILEAMQRVPRHLFTPEDSRDQAYEDYPITLPEENATISQPYMTAYMTDVLNIQPSDRILEIGTGSGYQAALLSHLCWEVYTIERYPSLSQNAQDVIRSLGITNVFFRVDDGLKGWPERAPFNKIMVTAAMRDAPSSLLDQLEEDGILLIPLGNSRHQTLIRFTKREGRFNMQDLIQCVFVPLISDARDMTQNNNDDFLGLLNQ